MNIRNDKNTIFTNRPILIIANSSWYLHHYRSLLIKEISLKNQLFTMSPIDKYSKKLSENSIYIPWNIHRQNDFNLFSLIFSLLKLLLMVRALKPKLIHSHTLKTNLLSAIVASLYGLPCVLSFAGMGRLSKSNGIKYCFFKLIINLIYQFSIRKRKTKWKWEKTKKRSFFIFQNPNDQEIFKKIVPDLKSFSNKVIPGSGVPSKYFAKDIIFKNKWLDKNVNKSIKLEDISFIYCARLLKSKGICVFLDLLKEFSSSKGFIFGDIDPSSNDSLNPRDLKEFPKLYSNVFFEGNVKDPMLKIKECYPILIVPSNYGEGLSRSIIEALSLKIPVICSQTALSGTFNEKYLFYTNMNESFFYKNKVFEIINNYERKKLITLIDRGFNKVKNNLTEEKIVQSTISIYDKLLKDNNSSYLIKKQKYNESFWLAQ